MAEKHTHPGKKNGNGKKSKKVFQLKMQLNFKNVVIGLFALFFLFFVLGSIGSQAGLAEMKPLSTVVADVKEGMVTIDVEDAKLTVINKDRSNILDKGVAGFPDYRIERRAWIRKPSKLTLKI